jgi:hypothetical protein
MITRREAEAYEKDARADERLAAAEKKMYATLSKIVRPRKEQGCANEKPPIIAAKAPSRSVGSKKK